MRYRDWNKLNEEEKMSTHRKQHPRIRVATIFTILFAVVFGVALLRIFKNKRVYVNRKPNKLEAFTVAKSFVKNKLTRAATFSNHNFDAEIDTAQNAYHISSYVNAQDSTGQFVKTNWQINLSYAGGAWADTTSWRLIDLKFNR
ncbi:hypothetical protein [Mucilaginibacter sp.]|uniref:hypothetical protein n=1 Tax=Mucilaginibacter sp. TaxID=1882438 RepID=UPI003266B2DB